MKLKKIKSKCFQVWNESNQSLIVLGHFINCDLPYRDFYKLKGSSGMDKARKLIADWQSKSIEGDDGVIRQFESGATRDTAENKLDFEGFLCPRVLTAYAEYMHKNRVQSDGSLRDSDNWQKGIPQDAYMKSMFRHFMDVWKNHRGLPTKEDEITNLCAMLFNVMGKLHEVIKQQEVNE